METRRLSEFLVGCVVLPGRSELGRLLGWEKLPVALSVSVNESVQNSGLARLGSDGWLGL